MRFPIRPSTRSPLALRFNFALKVGAGHARPFDVRQKGIYVQSIALNGVDLHLDGIEGASLALSACNATGAIVVNAMKAGTILIEIGTPLPQSLLLEGENYSSSWTSVSNFDRSELDAQITKAGWTFFYMAGKIKTTVFGFDKEKTLRTAVKRLITSARPQKCNCLEITQVVMKSFLRMPYVTVSAHSRHIQASPVLVL
jgi:hypothetical protein